MPLSLILSNNHQYSTSLYGCLTKAILLFVLVLKHLQMAKKTVIKRDYSNVLCLLVCWYFTILCCVFNTLIEKDVNHAVVIMITITMTMMMITIMPMMMIFTIVGSEGANGRGWRENPVTGKLKIHPTPPLYTAHHHHLDHDHHNHYHIITSSQSKYL